MQEFFRPNVVWAGLQFEDRATMAAAAVCGAVNLPALSKISGNSGCAPSLPPVKL